ncbi:MFS transporter [Chitinophaga horti]|uniref:MFS transporter n=1 Tax=Chitinophaga horti TaxID=2920382 RepID=A0ABY6J0B2_9BACT|nr:MFS transporter [Chitinophaga horti]UYQ91811.1 MFS transporter [Chitinophaga horti]
MNSTVMSRYRWNVVTLLFFATTINYIDRQVMGLLKDDLAKAFNWTETDYGNLVTAFSAAYAIGLLAFGRIVDKLGSKMGYTISITLWSIAAMANAAAKSTFGFGAARVALGFGEGGNFPSAIKATAEWFPKKERAFATGIFNAGANIGAVVGPAIVYGIARQQGWESAFLWTGAIGFVWLVLWWVFYEVPARHKKINKAEFDYIHSDEITPADPVATEAAIQEPQKKIPWVKLFGIRQTWAFLFGKLLTDPVWWFFLFWMPSYLSNTYNVNMKDSLGLPIIVIYTITSVGSIGGGWLSSYLIKRGWPIFKARKTSMLIFAVCVLPVMLIQYVDNLWTAVLLLSLATAAHQAWSANIFTTASDMFPKSALSSVVGIGGMAGSVGGMLFPLVVGAMLDHYKVLGNINTGYNLLFTICAFAYLLAWLLMHLFAPKMEMVEVK